MKRENIKIFDVLGLGCTAVDDVLFVPRYPSADGKVEVARRERYGGGLTATALVAAKRLGARCAYAGVMGRDLDSEFVLESLRREQIDVTHALRRPKARPVRSVIVVEPDRGTRTIFYETSGEVGAGPHHPPRSLITACRVLFVDRFGMTGMIRAARIARAAGIPVVGDFESLGEPLLDQLLPLVDHLILPEATALRLTGRRQTRAAVPSLLAGTRQVVVVTCGDRGCWFQEKGMPKSIHHPAFKVKVVDTTGCGDVFHGAYAAGLARGLGLRERIQLASAAAALKATKAGGQQGIPTLRTVRRYLHEASL